MFFILTFAPPLIFTSGCNTANISLFFIFANHLLIFVNRQRARPQKKAQAIAISQSIEIRASPNALEKMNKRNNEPTPFGIYRQCSLALLIYKTDERCVLSIPSLFEIGDFVFRDKAKNALYFMSRRQCLPSPSKVIHFLTQRSFRRVFLA